MPALKCEAPLGAMIGIDAPMRPALLVDPPAADPHLVLDRGVTLKVRRISGVDDGAHRSRPAARQASTSLESRAIGGDRSCPFVSPPRALRISPSRRRCWTTFCRSRDRLHPVCAIVRASRHPQGRVSQDVGDNVGVLGILGGDGGGRNAPKGMRAQRDAELFEGESREVTLKPSTSWACQVVIQRAVLVFRVEELAEFPGDIAAWAPRAGGKLELVRLPVLHVLADQSSGRSCLGRAKVLLDVDRDEGAES